MYFPPVFEKWDRWYVLFAEKRLRHSCLDCRGFLFIVIGVLYPLAASG